MSQHISSLISVDPRTLFERLSRRDVWKLAEAHGISYPPSAPKDAVIKILEANNVNPLAKPPEGDGIKFESINVPMENGSFKQELYPVRKDHATANTDIDYQTRLDNISDKQVAEEAAERKAKDEAQTNEIAELKAMVAQLMSRGSDIPEPKVTDNKFSAMKMQDLRKAAKAAGIKVMPTFKKVDLIRMLEDGENTTSGS